MDSPFSGTGASTHAAISTPATEQLQQIAWLDADGALAKLDARRSGLLGQEVESRRRQFGRNEVSHERPPAWYAHLWHAFANPFNLLVTTLAVVSGLTGDEKAVVVIGVMVLLSTGLRFVQESRSTKAAEGLRALVSTRIAVERSGDEFPPDSTSATRRREIPMGELVPGDIVYLSAGDMVPADVRVIAAKDLFISQSALTGEGLPVEKTERADRPGSFVATTELPTVCFMGTSVVSGTATAVVAATGSRTAVGSMAKGLLGQRVTTAFDVGVNKVSWLFIRFILVMVPVVILINGFTKHDWLEACSLGSPSPSASRPRCCR